LLVAAPLMSAEGRRGDELPLRRPRLTAIAAVPILGQSLNPGVVIGLALSLVGVSLVGGGRREA
jgi:hypothetical protein